MNKNSEKVGEKEKQENLLMFCGMAFMAAGPAFWFLMNSTINARLVTLPPDIAGLMEVVNVAVALLFAVSGAALALAGWGLSAWHAWRKSWGADVAE